MGKWIYVNGLVLLVGLVFMYLHFGTYYQPPWHVYVLASLLWIMLYALGHYIFIYSMKLEKKGRQKNTVEGGPTINTATQTERPRVILKKERPKVDLKKKNDNNHGK